jgi:WS/DGAT/MGAT family acyltransferase
MQRQMQRLSATDSTFVYAETKSMLLQNTAVLIFDPDSMPGGYSFERLRELMASRVAGIPVYTRRLVEIPLDLGRPVWAEDPDFDLDAHLHRRGLPAPASMAELADFVADVSSTPLDRSRPLWKTWIVEGLENGRIAMVAKAHHAAMDGVTGADVLSNLLDVEIKDPADEPEPEPVGWMSALPSTPRLLLDAALGGMIWPTTAVRSVVGAMLGTTSVARRLVFRDSQIPDPAIPLTAPSTPFNAAITPHRSIGFGSIDLEDVKRIRRAHGVTVNDVVLAACTAALREWLAYSEARIPPWLLACLPVSVHDSAAEVQSGNKVSAMFVRLPVGEPDPVEQLHAIAAETAGAKDVHEAMGAKTIMGLAEFAPRRVLNLGTRLYSSLQLADRHRPIYNLVISNVPGPPIPLYFGGARMTDTYFFGPVFEGSGLNLTVVSYDGKVGLGAIGCRELVPDIDVITHGFEKAVPALLEAH